MKSRKTYHSKRIDVKSGFYRINGELVAGDAPYNSSENDIKVNEYKEKIINDNKRPSFFGYLTEDEFFLIEKSAENFRKELEKKISWDNIDETIIGIPSSPGKAYIDLFKGIIPTKIKFVYEPLAVMFSALKKINNGVYLICDFGGGTLDLILLNYFFGIDEIIDRIQINFGGINIDNSLKEYLYKKYELDKQEGSLNNSMLLISRRLKEKLSSNNEATDFLLLKNENYPIKIRIIRDEFEENVLSGLMSDVYDQIDNFVKKYKYLEPNCIISSGGSSNIPFFRKYFAKLIKETFNKKIEFSSDIFSVTNGLANSEKYSVLGERITFIDPSNGKSYILYDYSDIPFNKEVKLQTKKNLNSQDLIQLDFCKDNFSEPFCGFKIKPKSQTFNLNISLDENLKEKIKIESENACIIEENKNMLKVGNEISKDLVISKIQSNILEIPLEKIGTKCKKCATFYVINTNMAKNKRHYSSHNLPEKKINFMDEEYSYEIEPKFNSEYFEDILLMRLIFSKIVMLKDTLEKLKFLISNL